MASGVSYNKDPFICCTYYYHHIEEVTYGTNDMHSLSGSAVRIFLSSCRGLWIHKKFAHNSHLIGQVRVCTWV